jgi:outer membrane protein, heavy metal efflux system
MGLPPSCWFVPRVPWGRARLGGYVAAAWLCSAALADAQPPPTVEPLTLAAAMTRALAANPTIAAARRRRDIDIAGVALARERPYPEAHVELTNELPRQAYGLAVPLETAGKRRRRIAVSEAALRSGDAELVRIIIEVHAQVRRAYFNRVVSVSRLALLNDLTGLATRARDAARARFEAGSAPRLEMIQAELALAQAENDAIAALAAATAASVQLNALLGLPLDAVVALTSPIETAAATTFQAAIGIAQASNAELAVLDRRIEEQRLKIGLARAMQVPDIIPDATITRDAGTEFTTGWRAAVAVGVPLFSRHRAAVQLEEATLSQLTADRAAALARITGEVTAIGTLVEAQRQQYLRYRDRILPQALEVERMAEDSYRLGQTGIAALLQAFQAARDARLRALQAAADFQNAVADLERAIGKPIP